MKFLHNLGVDDPHTTLLTIPSLDEPITAFDYFTSFADLEAYISHHCAEEIKAQNPGIAGVGDQPTKWLDIFLKHPGL